MTLADTITGHLNYSGGSGERIFQELVHAHLTPTADTAAKTAKGGNTLIKNLQALLHGVTEDQISVNLDLCAALKVDEA